MKNMSSKFSVISKYVKKFHAKYGIGNILTFYEGYFSIYLKIYKIFLFI